VYKIRRYILTYRPGLKFENVDIFNSKCARKFCIDLLSKFPIEKIVIIALDAQKKLIGYDYVVGTSSECIIYFQHIFRFLLSIGAESFIIAHNHPFGDTISSKEDRDLRDTLAVIGQSLDIPMVDNLIVAGNRCRSMMRDK
jgi:DNA repair protein RadC